MAQYEFLDYEGLKTYDELIKKYIDDADAESIKVVQVSRDGKSIEFYKQTPGFGVTADYSIELPDIDTSDLMKLVSDAVEGNIAVFDDDGQVIDSDISVSDLATMEYVGEIPEGYESTTIVDFVQEVANYISSHGYDDTELKARMSAAEEAIDILNGDEDTEGSVAKAVADAKGDIDDEIEEVKEELTEAIDTAVANAGHLKREIVNELPDVSEADELTIYMVLKESESQDDTYDEYMVINGAWEKIGNTSVDLTDYAKTEYVDNKAEETLTEAKEYADGLVEELDTFETIPTEDIEALFS